MSRPFAEGDLVRCTLAPAEPGEDPITITGLIVDKAADMELYGVREISTGKVYDIEPATDKMELVLAADDESDSEWEEDNTPVQYNTATVAIPTPLVQWEAPAVPLPTPMPVDTGMLRLEAYKKAIPRLALDDIKKVKKNIEAALMDVLPMNFDNAEVVERDLYQLIALRQMELFLDAVRDGEMSTGQANATSRAIVERAEKLGVNTGAIDDFLAKLYDIQAARAAAEEAAMPAAAPVAATPVVPAFVAPVDQAIADAQAGIRPVVKEVEGAGQAVARAVERGADAIVDAGKSAVAAVENAVTGKKAPAGRKPAFGGYSYTAERAKAQAKADAYWAAHPRARTADMSRTAKKVVRKAANYKVNQNDFAGVDTRNMGRKLGLVKW